jgi:hypothetical protein
VTKSLKKSSAGRSNKVRTSGAATVRKNKPAAKKAKARTADAPPTAISGEKPPCDDEAAYLETVIASGEAARLDQEGKLPTGATHKIVEDDAGNVKVVRRRFSIS